MTINFKKLKQLYNNVEINVDSENNKIEFNEDSCITYIYGLNGSGKSTICKALEDSNEELCDKKIEVFSYDKDFYFEKDKIIINKNIATINRLENEAAESFDNDIFEISKYLATLNIYSTTKFIQEFILTNDIYFEKLCFKKIPKKPILKWNDYFAILNVQNIDQIEKYKILLNQKNNLSDDFGVFLESDIDLNFIKTMKFLYNDTESLQSEVENFYKNFIENKIPNIKIEEINDILEFLKKYEWNCKKCPICHKDIDILSLKKELKKQSDEYYQQIQNNETLNEFLNKSKYFNKIQFSPIGEIKSSLKSFLELSSLESFVLSLSKLKKNIEEFLKNFENVIIEIQQKILNCYFIIDEQNKVKVKLAFYKNSEDSNTLRRDKSLFDVSSTKLVSDLIDQTIGKDRLKIDIQNGNISVDQETKKNSFTLSTGERNFVIIAFSLLGYIQRANNDLILLMDDPISSFDNNNKLNVIYLINYFANKYPNKFKSIIFTHNFDIINTQYNSNLCKNIPKLYLLKNEKNKFTHDEQTGFIEIPKNDINFLHIKTIKKTIVKKMQNLEINETFVKANISSFIILIPIIRSFLYINLFIDYKHPINKMLHYDKNISQLNAAPDIIKVFNIFFDFSSEQEYKSGLILEGIINFFEEFNKFEECKNKSFNLFAQGDNEYPSAFVKDSLEKLFYMIITRIFVEKYLFINSSKEINHKSDQNMRTLIKNSNLTDEKKDILMSKRILLHEYIHLENVINLVLPGIEVSWAEEHREIEEILKVFNKKDKSWINHN